MGRLLVRWGLWKPKAAVARVYTPQERERELGIVKAMVAAPVPSERELKMVEIIVLKYKDPEVETKCAQRIIEYTHWPFKMVFYDNRPGSKNFSKIFNKVIRESVCDYILIMDSDAFVPHTNPDWLTRMMKTFGEYPDCWTVVPRVNRTSCVQQRANLAEDKPPSLLTEPFAAQCVLYKKEVFEKVGWYDEDFLLYGQDTEWSARAIKKGYATYIRHDVLIDHGKHTSINKAAARGEFDRQIEGEYAANLLKEKTQ